jgi:hypothetical protein
MKKIEHQPDDLDFVARTLIEQGPRLAELGVRLESGADPDGIANEVALAAFDIHAVVGALGRKKEKEERRQAQLKLGLKEEQITKLELWNEMVECGPVL